MNQNNEKAAVQAIANKKKTINEIWQHPERWTKQINKQRPQLIKCAAKAIQWLSKAIP